MDTLLTKDAVSEVWCTPGMDQQLSLALVRLTEDKGVRGYLNLGWESVNAPDQMNYWHFFFIGSIPRDELGLTQPIGIDRWHNLDDLMVDNATIFNVYHSNSTEINLAACHVHLSENRGFMLAVRTSEVDLDAGNVHLRVYQNRYFETPRVPTYGKKVEVDFFKGGENTDLAAFIAKHEAYKNEPHGLATATYNGLTHSSINSADVDRFTLIDSVFDASIVETFEVKLSELRPFFSKKDKANKFLIHPTLKDRTTIRYYDDTEWYVVSKQGLKTGEWKGVRLPRFIGTELRQLTHVDFSFNASVLNRYKDAFFGDHTLDEVSLLIHFRRSGYRRPLKFVAEKIKALYRLPDNLIEEALLGINSNVDFWKAENLEDSEYVKLMSADFEDINAKFVADTYGYNGVCKTLFGTPLDTPVANGTLLELPSGYLRDSVVTEYDGDGNLLKCLQKTLGAYYRPSSNKTSFVELIVGESGYRMYQHWDEKSFTLNTRFNYRFYTAVRGDAGPTRWTDVTDGALYTLTGNTVKWNVDYSIYHTFVITDNTPWYFTDNLTEDNGLLSVDLEVNVAKPTENDEWVSMGVPFGYCRVWVNGKALIQNLDYVIKDSKLVVINKRYLYKGSVQDTITILGYGHCTKDLMPQALPDIQFVKWHRLSFNGRYDYRDDWLTRYTVGGSVYQHDELSFAEDGTAVVGKAALANGLPYTAEQVHPAIHNPISMKVFAAKVAADARDKKVMDYLTEKLPVPDPDRPNAILEKHNVFSPYLSKILSDLKEGRWIIPETRLTDEILLKYLLPYEWLLPYDPSRLNVNFSYIHIHPHAGANVVTVSKRIFDVLERVVGLKLDNKVDLTPFIGIEKGN